MKTPLALFIFNRPEKTKIVFEAIRKDSPETLYVIADGPRDEKEGKLCRAARSVIDSLDWKCQIIKNYAETNLGCRHRVSSGLDWVFERTDKAIILEDDCLPDESFFKFCEELLERYEEDDRIMHISGNYFQEKNKRFHAKDSYYFSIIPHIWGWATWSRAWKKYDVNMSAWPKLRNSKAMADKLASNGAVEYWTRVWDDYFSKKIDSWDGQWFFACLMNNGLCINPCQNLVSNIGFDYDATHTKSSSQFGNLPTKEMLFPLKHPEKIAANTNADAFTFRNNFGIDKKFVHRILRPVKKYAPDFYQMLRRLIKRT